MDLGNVSGYDTKTTQSGPGYEQRHVMRRRVCHHCFGRGTRPAKEQPKRGRMDPDRGIVEKELMNGRVAREMTEVRMEARRDPRAANPIGTATTTKEAREKARGKGRARAKPDTATDCGEQGHIGVNCPYKWANSFDEEDDHTSSWESERKGENAEELASLGRPDEGRRVVLA